MDLNEWTDDNEALAIRLPARLARKFFGRKDLVVPEECVCLLESDGERALLPAGSRRDKLADLALIKETLFTVEHDASGLVSADGHVFDGNLRFTAYIDTRSQEQAERFRRTFLPGPEDGCTLFSLRDRLAGEVRAALAGFVALHAGDKLDDEGIDEALERHLRAALKGALEDGGLELSRVRSARFHSEQLDGLRRAQAEARTRQEMAQVDQRLRVFMDDLERQGRIEQLKKKEELDRAYLEYDAGRQKEQQKLSHELRDAERAREQAARRAQFEEELERRRRAIEMFKSAGVGELLQQIPDEAERKRVYDGLFSNLTSPEEMQRQHQTGKLKGELEQLYAQLRTAAEQLAARGSGRFVALRGADETDRRTHRVLVASGRRVLAYDPKSNVQADQPREVYDMGPGALGGIRSVRLAAAGGWQHVLAGARGGVYVTTLRGPTDRTSSPATAFGFGAGAEGRTGVNAAGIVGSRLVATHSEHGLVAWELGSPGRPPQKLFPETTAGAASVRGLVVRDNTIYYAAENRVYAADLGREHPVPLLYSGPTAQVTSLVRQSGKLYAGTTDGAIYAWELDDPHSPVRVLHRQAKIYMIRAAVIGGVPHLFVGSKDRGVLCRYMEGSLDTNYQSGSLVRWADGAADYCFGVDYDSYQLIIWRAELPDTELRRIALPEPINDIWIVHKDVVA